jgi:hypothetical protein
MSNFIRSFSFKKKTLHHSFNARGGSNPPPGRYWQPAGWSPRDRVPSLPEPGTGPTQTLLLGKVPEVGLYPYLQTDRTGVKARVDR